jgi:hypothetical protein
MKSKFLLIILIATVLKTNCQTKSETQQWIVSTLNQYVDKSKYKLLNFYFFDDGKSFLTLELTGGNLYYEKIFLKEIKKVDFIEYGDSYEIRLSCFNNNCCETGYHIPNAEGTGIEKIQPNDERKNRIGFYLYKSVKDENMISRLRKSISHLVKLNGGKIVGESF